MIKMTEFAARRAQIMQQIGKNSIAILRAAPMLHRNHYHEHPYRQNSDFHYLTGFNEPEAVMVLAPGRPDGEYILFNRPLDPAQQTWDGYRAGQAGACDLFNANQSFPIADLTQKLPELLEGRDAIYFLNGAYPEFDSQLLAAVNTLRGKIRAGIEFPQRFLDIRPLLHEMRLIKSPAEIEHMRRAGEITAEGHIRAMQACRPGLYEYQLEAELTYVFIHNGARAHAYTPIVGSGENSCTLHYIFNTKKMAAGELVLIDAGAEYDYYAADVTRTIPVNGKFSAEQRAIYELVLAAQQTGIKAIKPGAVWADIENLITREITQGLKDVGLLKGDLDNLIESRAYFPFYMHRCGHLLGLDTHDAGPYRVDGKWRTLVPGMVRTMEPGIYISSTIPGVPERWHNIGIRIEDDVLVTASGNEVLSANAPKAITDIEAVMENGKKTCPA
jgi:Xaa-Pro aminopeptidase